VALQVRRGAAAHERVPPTAVTAQANHQQIDFLAEGRQLVHGDAIHRTAIDSVEFG